jgi:hypothetical protein
MTAAAFCCAQEMRQPDLGDIHWRAVTIQSGETTSPPFAIAVMRSAPNRPGQLVVSMVQVWKAN